MVLLRVRDVHKLLKEKFLKKLRNALYCKKIVMNLTFRGSKTGLVLTFHTSMLYFDHIPQCTVIYIQGVHLCLIKPIYGNN